jgi:putative PEP-CTERM system TPR-repeat lipoprotein
MTRRLRNLVTAASRTFLSASLAVPAVALTLDVPVAGIGLAASMARPAAAATDYLADALRLIKQGDLPAARLQLRNAVKADPKNAAAHYQLGLVSLHLGDPVLAEKEARAAQEGGYDPPGVLTLLTLAYLSQGRARDLLHDFPVLPGGAAGTAELAAVTLTARAKAQLLLEHADEASASLEEAIRLAPNAAPPLLVQAQIAMAAHDPKTALDKVNAALKLDPNSADALQMLAVLSVEKGDKEGAIAAANKAVANAPGEVAFRLERASAFIAFNRNDEARADVDWVLSIMPGNTRALYDRAVLLSRAGNYAAANTDLDKLSEFISRNPSAYLLLAIVKQRVGQVEQALDAANRYHARLPGDPRGTLVLARLQLQTRRPADAVTTLAPLATADSKDADVFDVRAAALSVLGRNVEALADYEKALAIKPDDAALLARTGAVRLALHQSAGATALLERSVAIAPEQPRTEALLIMALLDTGKFDEAEKSLDQLRKQQGTSELVGMLGGAMHLARFELDAARHDFEAVLHDHPDSMDARLSLARVAYMQGREDDRVRYLSEVVQREPARVAVVNDLVDALLRQNKAPDAIAVLQKAHSAAPGEPRLMARLAGLYISNHEPEKALALANEIPPDAPADKPAPGATAITGQLSSGGHTLPWLLVKAEAEVALKKPDAAETTYREVLDLAPRFVLARLQLVQLLMNGKTPDDAKSVLDEGLLTDPQNDQLLHAAVELAGRQGNGEPAAMAAATELAKDSQHQPASLVLPGDLLLGSKHYDEAIKTFAAAQQAAPSPVMAMHLAIARIAGGHSDEAAQGLREWLGQHPGDLEVEGILADIELKAGHYDVAKTLLSDLLTKRPNDAKVLNNLAWVDQQVKDSQAVLLAQRAYDLAPGPQTADTWGYILATAGGGDHGVSLLRMASMQAPNDPAIKYHLAVAYQAAGQPAEAVKILTPLMDTPADFPDKSKAKELLTTLSAKP